MSQLPCLTGDSGSLQSAARILGTPRILVLGHEGCGAVQAALEVSIMGRTIKRIFRSRERYPSKPMSPPIA